MTNDQFIAETTATALSVHLNLRMVMGACAWVPPPGVVEAIGRFFKRLFHRFEKEEAA